MATRLPWPHPDLMPRTPLRRGRFGCATPSAALRHLMRAFLRNLETRRKLRRQLVGAPIASSCAATRFAKWVVAGTGPNRGLRAADCVPAPGCRRVSGRPSQRHDDCTALTWPSRRQCIGDQQGETARLTLRMADDQ